MAGGRQLSMFGSRRARGTREAAPAEFALQCAVADTLRRWAEPGWIWTHIPLGEKREKITAARLKRMGTNPGWADLILIAPRTHAIQRPHFLELKRRGEDLNDNQDDFWAWCHANECPHAIADNYHRAVEILKNWGALKACVVVQ